MAGKERPSERLVIYVTPAMKTALERIAKREGDRSVSSLIREVLAERIARDE